MGLKEIKLGDKSEKYICVSYDQYSKPDKIYNSIDGKVVISRDIKFYKESTLEWNISKDGQNFQSFVIENEEMMQSISLPSTPPPKNLPIEERSSSVWTFWL